MYEYIFDAEACWYKKTCDKYKTDECNASCIRYMELHYMMANSGIPKNRQKSEKLIPMKADIEAFEALQEIKLDIRSFVEEGESLYIFSEKFGNGKTSWSIKMLQQYFDDVWAGNGFKKRGLFLHVPTFLAKIKDGISSRDLAFEELRRDLTKVDLVVWDDIGAIKLSDFDHSNLLVYIDQRKLHGLSDIYTGNLGGGALQDALGNRLFSRVWHGSYTVELVGMDMRNSKW